MTETKKWWNIFMHIEMVYTCGVSGFMTSGLFLEFSSTSLLCSWQHLWDLVTSDPLGTSCPKWLGALCKTIKAELLFPVSTSLCSRWDEWQVFKTRCGSDNWKVTCTFSSYFHTEYWIIEFKILSFFFLFFWAFFRISAKIIQLAIFHCRLWCW